MEFNCIVYRMAERQRTETKKNYLIGEWKWGKQYLVIIGDFI